MLKPFCFYADKKKAAIKLVLSLIALALVVLIDGLIYLLCSGDFVHNFKDLIWCVAIILLFSVPTVYVIATVVREILILVRNEPLLKMSDDGLLVDYLFYKVNYPLSSLNYVLPQFHVVQFIFEIEARSPWLILQSLDRETYQTMRRSFFKSSEKGPVFTLGNIHMGRHNVPLTKQADLIAQYVMEYNNRMDGQLVQPMISSEYVDANSVPDDQIKIEYYHEELNSHEKSIKRWRIVAWVMFFLIIIILIIGEISKSVACS